MKILGTPVGDPEVPITIDGFGDLAQNLFLP
jgi:hypothetical protein